MFSDPNAAALHYLPRAEILARNRSLRPADRDDLAQEGILLLLEVASRYARENRKVLEPDKFATRVMSRAMHWWNYRMHANRGCVIEHVGDLEAALHPRDKYGRRSKTAVRTVHFGIIGDDDLFELTLVREFFDELERMHGHDVRLLAEELAMPGPEAAMVAMEAQADKIQQYAAGAAVRGVHSLRVSRVHIRQAFCLPRLEWNRQVRLVRDFGESFFGRTLTVPAS